MRVDSALVDGLGLVVEENVMGEFVPVDMGRATNVPVSSPPATSRAPARWSSASMGDGVMAGGRANMDLVEEDFALKR